MIRTGRFCLCPQFQPRRQSVHLSRTRIRGKQGEFAIDDREGRKLRRDGVLHAIGDRGEQRRNATDQLVNRSRKIGRHVHVRITDPPGCWLQQPHDARLSPERGRRGGKEEELCCVVESQLVMRAPPPGEGERDRRSDQHEGRGHVSNRALGMTARSCCYYGVGRGINWTCHMQPNSAVRCPRVYAPTRPDSLPTGSVFAVADVDGWIARSLDGGIEIVRRGAALTCC